MGPWRISGRKKKLVHQKQVMLLRTRVSSPRRYKTLQQAGKFKIGLPIWKSPGPEDIPEGCELIIHDDENKKEDLKELRPAR